MSDAYLKGMRTDMHNIGNDHDALTILHWVRSHPKNDYGKPMCAIRKESPEGWKYLGHGAYRSAWLSPEGVVYKVGHSSWDWEDQSRSEVLTLKKLWGEPSEIPEGCRIPRFHPYTVDQELVVAVEEIRGVLLDGYDKKDRAAKSKLVRLMESRFRLWDLHGENVMIDEQGAVVVVDYGG